MQQPTRFPEGAAARPAFRFAPSPTGALHVGHALSAWLNAEAAEAAGGRFLLRIEDIDRVRCTPQNEAAITRDLAWLGLSWEEPARRQSEHLAFYRAALDGLIARGLVYPAALSRGESRAIVAAGEAAGTPWPRDPDGAPLHPPGERRRSPAEQRRLVGSGTPFAWRLDVLRALAQVDAETLGWTEEGEGPRGETGAVRIDPALWGDVVIARKDFPASYHLAVVLDDAAQGIDTVIRGQDLFYATAVHRLLQALLGLPAPRYRHHRLIRAPDGRKLSKSNGDTSLAALRERGLSPDDIRRIVGLPA